MDADRRGYSPLRAWLRRERRREWNEAAARDVHDPFWQMIGPEVERPWFEDDDRRPLRAGAGTFSNLLSGAPVFNELDMKRSADAAIATLPPGPARDALDSLMRRARRRFFG